MKNTAYAYGYTGNYQTFTAPCNGYYKMEAWGASGTVDITNAPSGLGGYSAGVTKISSGTTLYSYVGKSGDYTTYAEYLAYSYNGGGCGYDYGESTVWNSRRYYANGGGASDFRIISGNWDNNASLRSRIIVAGGGGGGGTQSTEYYGGSAGGLISYFGETSGGISGAKVATQTDGYTFGYGICAENGPRWSGSGGGWYGGQGNTSGSFVSATITAGGSSYISGHTGSVGVASTSSSSPKTGCTTGTTNNACSLTPYINPATGTSYTFTNTLMIDGAGYKWTNTKQGLQQMPNPSGGYYASGVGHSGNGAARITYLGTTI